MQNFVYWLNIQVEKTMHKSYSYIITPVILLGLAACTPDKSSQHTKSHSAKNAISHSTPSKNNIPSPMAVYNAESTTDPTINLSKKPHNIHKGTPDRLVSHASTNKHSDSQNAPSTIGAAINSDKPTLHTPPKNTILYKHPATHNMANSINPMDLHKNIHSHFGLQPHFFIGLSAGIQQQRSISERNDINIVYSQGNGGYTAITPKNTRYSNATPNTELTMGYLIHNSTWAFKTALYVRYIKGSKYHSTSDGHVYLFGQNAFLVGDIHKQIADNVDVGILLMPGLVISPRWQAFLVTGYGINPYKVSGHATYHDTNYIHNNDGVYDNFTHKFSGHHAIIGLQLDYKVNTHIKINLQYLHNIYRKQTTTIIGSGFKPPEHVTVTTTLSGIHSSNNVALGISYLF